MIQFLMDKLFGDAGVDFAFIFIFIWMFLFLV